MDSRQIGARIRARRVATGLTQQELADRAGVNLMMINRYEKGHILPSVDSFLAIADALDVSTDYLAGRTDDPKGPVSGLTPREQRLITNARKWNISALLYEITALSEEFEKMRAAGADKRPLDTDL